MKDNKYLQAFYEGYDEDGRLLSRHGQVEYLTTLRYIDRYLKEGMRILEIGAGTGRYSHTLARRGYEVDAVELLSHHIELFQKNTEAGEQVRILQGDARDLSMLPDEGYDMTLLLGPMYHLYTKEDQLRALQEAVRVTKTGGVIYIAYCMGDASILSYGFIRGCIDELIADCKLDTTTFATFSNPWDIFELYRREDIDALRETLPLTQLHFVATDGYTNHMRETVDGMNDRVFDLFLRYHFATCERGDLVGYSHHTLDIVRKERKYEYD